MLEKAGVDAIHVSAGGLRVPLPTIVPPLDSPVGMSMGNVAAVKSIATIPVVAAIRINDPIMADSVIEEGRADFIAVGRGNLPIPSLPIKRNPGDFDDVIKCIGCNQGCVDRLFMEGKSISCLRNPRTGREMEYAIEPVKQKKKVLVVGGGPAGLEAAAVLKRRGHEVVLIERDNRLGGQFFLAGTVSWKKEMAEAALQMGRIAGRLGVDIRLNTPLTEDLLEKIRPDEIVVATGSKPILPDIKGVTMPHVITGHEVLAGLKSTGPSVAVIGGGLIGMEVAELLHSEKKKVTIVEMLDEVANGLGLTRKPFALKFIQENGVNAFVRAKCLEIKNKNIVLEQNGEIREIGDFDSVVMAVGVKPDPSVETFLKGKGYPFRVVGDAREAKKALDAIWDGADVGRTI